MVEVVDKILLLEVLELVEVELEVTELLVMVLHLYKEQHKN